MTTQIIIADDFTGAGDSGVHFARSGSNTALLLDLADLETQLNRYQTLSLSTESRFLNADDAFRAVLSLTNRCSAAAAHIIFKKVDSTLRGNLGKEIEAVLTGTQYQAALVCTAMPKTGRTCTNGCLYLHGTPLHQTEIGRDPFTPVYSSAVTEVLATQTAFPTANLSLEDVRAKPELLRQKVAALVNAGCRIVAADAETDADLAVLGALLRDSHTQNSELPSLLPVGAGGLAEAFIGTTECFAPPVPQGRILAIVGSLTGVSKGQAEIAVHSGAFHPITLDITAAIAEPAKTFAHLAQQAQQAEGKHLVLRTADTPHPGHISGQEGTRVAFLFGRAAKAICSASPCDILYATGGSTAVAVADALGIKAIRLETECMPGIVLSSCAIPGLCLRWVISKAGGFGTPDVLTLLAARVTRP